MKRLLIIVTIVGLSFSISPVSFGFHSVVAEMMRIENERKKSEIEYQQLKKQSEQLDEIKRRMNEQAASVYKNEQPYYSEDNYQPQTRQITDKEIRKCQKYMMALYENVKMVIKENVKISEKEARIFVASQYPKFKVKSSFFDREVKKYVFAKFQSFSPHENTLAIINAIGANEADYAYVRHLLTEWSHDPYHAPSLPSTQDAIIFINNY